MHTLHAPSSDVQTDPSDYTCRPSGHPAEDGMTYVADESTLPADFDAFMSWAHVDAAHLTSDDAVRNAIDAALREVPLGLAASVFQLRGYAVARDGRRSWTTTWQCDLYDGEGFTGTGCTPEAAVAAAMSRLLAKASAA